MLDVERARSFAQKPSPTSDGMLPGGPQRERGMWSFLTWSFFLSQLAVGNAFAGGSAQAADSVDLSTPAAPADPTVNTTAAPGASDLRTSSGDDSQSGQASGGSAQSHSGPTAAAPDFANVERVHLSDDASLAVRSFASQGVGLLEGGAAEPDVPVGEIPGVELPPLIELPPVVSLPPVIDGILPPILDVLPPILDGLPPVLDTIDDLVEGLGPILGDILVPIVEKIEDLGNVLGPVIDHVLVPIEDVVDNVIDDVGELVAPIGGAVDQILDLADPILDNVDAALPPIAGLVDAVEPIVNALDALKPLDILQFHDKPVLGILPLNIGGGLAMGAADGAGDVVGLPGHIDFAVDAEPIVHELFQGGAYTEYGLAMQQVPLVPAGGIGEAMVDVAAVADVLLGDDDDAGHDPPAFFGHLQHEIGLRGLGDGLI
jgi:hypothetical protein